MYLNVWTKSLDKKKPCESAQGYVGFQKGTPRTTRAECVSRRASGFRVQGCLNVSKYLFISDFEPHGLLSRCLV